MLKKETLDYLSKQRESKFSFEGVNKLELTTELLENIGDKNNEIRDGLIYPCLAHLLYDKHFDEATLTTFLYSLFSEKHLFFDIDNKIGNSVLTRSFSSLQIVILLHVHKRDKIFKEDTIRELFKIYLDYFKKEKHLEGYNKEVGWLHSIAHSADVFDQFFTLEYFKQEEIKLMLEAILLKLHNRDYYFSHDEDERMVVGITKAIKRNLLSKEYLIDWVERFSTYEKNGDYPEMYFITNNIKNFLRSLYFAILEEEKHNYLTDIILESLKENVGLR
ncbi:hypothetical protein KQ51_01716 [Candidatus Izimaplasma bacterium HR1]|jgi:hypothetical protein|uniref:DUF2785 domain-containing protein n=1 Tax=Candidatus Izimoplasma sp. HR1 TaxID=1541959 RepID=UPI0004F58762|nr:hypothetical protein KQ51_01716 [Candidatus Izimaplasma bacterium HR1]